MTNEPVTIRRIASIAFHETAAAWEKRGPRMRRFNKEDFQELTAALFGYKSEALYRKAIKDQDIPHDLVSVQFVVGKKNIPALTLKEIADSTKAELQKTIVLVFREIHPDVVYKANPKSLFKGNTAMRIINKRLRTQSARQRFGGLYAVYPKDSQHFTAELGVKKGAITCRIEGWAYPQATLDLPDLLAGVLGAEAVKFTATFSLQRTGPCFYNNMKLESLVPNPRKRRRETMRAHQPADSILI